MEGQYRKRCLGFAQQHDAAVPGELWCQPLDKRNEARVYKEEAVRRMVDNVHDLVIEQPRVDGVTDGAYTRDAVIQLEMPEGIPGEGAYSVTGLDPEPQQRAGEPLGSALGLSVGVAMDRSFDGSRDNLGVMMIGCCVDEDRRYEERPLGHHPSIGLLLR
jgi:hypothetical protein